MSMSSSHLNFKTDSNYFKIYIASTIWFRCGSNIEYLSATQNYWSFKLLALDYGLETGRPANDLKWRYVAINVDSLNNGITELKLL